MRLRSACNSDNSLSDQAQLRRRIQTIEARAALCHRRKTRRCDQLKATVEQVLECGTTHSEASQGTAMHKEPYAANAQFSKVTGWPLAWSANGIVIMKGKETHAVNLAEHISDHRWKAAKDIDIVMSILLKDGIISSPIEAHM